MSIQLPLDFASQSQQELSNGTWIDVSDIARGVGFTTACQISSDLHDAFRSPQNKLDEGYDQRLYDCLWLARFQLSLDQSQSATFNFIFPRKGWQTDAVSEVRLRVRVEMCKQVASLGLMEGFRVE